MRRQYGHSCGGQKYHHQKLKADNMSRKYPSLGNRKLESYQYTYKTEDIQYEGLFVWKQNETQTQN